MAPVYNTYIYEGETEEKFIASLLETELIPAGKKQKFNLWDKEVSNILRKFKPKNNNIYIVFDTDITTNLVRFNRNLKRLSKDASVKKIFLMQQTLNLEDELLYCCGCTRAKLLSSFGAEGIDEFKSKFIKEKRITYRLEELAFDSQKLWTRALNSSIVVPAKKTQRWMW